MNVDKLIEESKSRVKNGQGYLDIAEYLKECGADEKDKQKVFQELDKEKLKDGSAKLNVSLWKLILGLPLTGYAIYLLWTLQFSGKSIIWVAIIFMVGGVTSVIEIAKLIRNNFYKRQHSVRIK
jgi:hypothetical protein